MIQNINKNTKIILQYIVLQTFEMWKYESPSTFRGALSLQIL